MERKRDRTQIISDMLTAIMNKGGTIKPTHLMYKSNLAHKQMKSYLEELIDKTFIKKVEKSGYDYLMITDSGLKFLEKIKEMKEFERTFGL